MSQPEPENTPVERVIARGLEDAEGIGKPLSSRARQRRRTVEAYLRSGAPPRWMQRIGDIDRGILDERRRLERAHRALLDHCGDDPTAFAARWTERARSWRFDALNELITQHNEWYPIERDLPMDIRTRDYVLVNGRSFRRPLLDADWILAHFPAQPS
ncbi:MAG: hypothetical protein JWM71_1911 [Solirubrobacteraceae bacterium]|nr:hypothetical protein [Solirubrobacteraceae bacterium]